jgi:hypothetical protein
MPINNYIEKINKLYKTGNAREHSYRGDLQSLINTIVPDVLVTNDLLELNVAHQIILLQREIFQLVILKQKILE